MLKIRLNKVDYYPSENQFKITYSFIGDNIKYTAEYTSSHNSIFEIKEIIEFLAKLYRVDKEEIQLIYKNYLYQYNKIVKIY